MAPTGLLPAPCWWQLGIGRADFSTSALNVIQRTQRAMAKLYQMLVLPNRCEIELTEEQTTLPSASLAETFDTSNEQAMVHV
jgi:hypothetical protein